MGNFDVEKTIVVPDSGGTENNFLAGMLASACQSKGLDANAVMALCGNRNGSFGNGWDGIIALIVIACSLWCVRCVRWLSICLWL